MNALFDLFDDAERRTLARLGAAAILALVIFLALFTRIRGGLAGERTGAVQPQESAQKAAKARDEARIQWKLWEDAGRDLAELRAGYFYDEQGEVQTLRQDLEKIFAQAGTAITDISYVYSDMEKEQVRKTLVTFTVMIVLVSFVSFAIIELPPGDYLTQKLEQLRARGDRSAENRIEDYKFR